MRKDRDVEAKIASEATRAAHRFLLNAMPQLGLTPSHNSGFVSAVRLHDDHNRYLFSWVPAKAHLTFYVRKPALKATPHLARSIEHLSLSLTTNRGGEIKARIETEADARRLRDWLASELPLHA
ncbi:hypothetical protein ACFOMD_11530 [Sphingoaurantiacus capsulatus]|uniref:DUF5655 domain-containing protein n=1 Tax=Sphingoaurantiacus capsulatus TaxID=1771310 RepID=A0ABV7XBX0_9SPHN